MQRLYYDFNAYLTKRFGCRVQKITIDAGFSCPNRDGTLSFAGCIYCDAAGSGTGAAAAGLSIAKQICRAKPRLAARYKARKFVAYFQAFSNTYGPCGVLRERYDEALQDPDVVGLSIGTRPDCVDEEKLDMIGRYTSSHMVWLEYGLQSAHDETLARINRGHTFEDFRRAVRMTQERGILVCAHVILGLPGETVTHILQTADALASLGIDGIKIHGLYVVDTAPMAGLLRSGAYRPLDLATYADWVVAFLERLPPTTVVQRLTGDPDPSRLLAPAWAARKQETLALIHRNLEERRTRQGRIYDSFSFVVPRP